MKILLFGILAIPIVYLFIATVLIHLPVKRLQNAEGLDFSALDVAQILGAKSIVRSFTTRDQETLFYRIIGEQSPSVIVFLHGSGSEGRYLLPLLENLHRATGIMGIALDLRGHGLSSLGHPGDIRYMGQLEHDLEDLLKHLKSSMAEATFILAGHSSGGGLALRYAAAEFLSFDGVVLLAPYLGFDAPTVRRNSGGWVQVAQGRYIGLAMLNSVGVTLFNDSQVLFFNRPVGVSDELQTDSYTYRLNESFTPRDYAQELAAIKKPLITLVGDQDEAFYSEQFEPIMNQHAPEAEFSLIKDSKHLDLVDHEDTEKLIRAWIAKHHLNKLIRQ